MSIVTKKGDSGTTALMYNRRLSKCDPRVEAYGSVDELMAALGLARASAERDLFRQQLLAVQKDLILLMGELATSSDDLERYIRDGYPRIGPDNTRQLEIWIQELETRSRPLRGWAIPGASPHSAALEVARTVCRRAERRVCALQENGMLLNSEIIVYLNRVSDWMWLLARAVEPPPAPVGSENSPV